MPSVLASNPGSSHTCPGLEHPLWWSWAWGRRSLHNYAGNLWLAHLSPALFFFRRGFRLYSIAKNSTEEPASVWRGSDSKESACIAYSPWGHKESDRTEWLNTFTQWWKANWKSANSPDDCSFFAFHRGFWSCVTLEISMWNQPILLMKALRVTGEMGWNLNFTPPRKSWWLHHEQGSGLWHFLPSGSTSRVS